MAVTNIVALAYPGARINWANIALIRILAVPKFFGRSRVAVDNPKNPSADIVVVARGKAVKEMVYIIESHMADTRFAVVAVARIEIRRTTVGV